MKHAFLMQQHIALLLLLQQQPKHAVKHMHMFTPKVAYAATQHQVIAHSRFYTTL
jgi:hypothetical protein